ncbi:MAG: DUF1446 domain-containing protein [Firmicutes bacterium]|nr:DUF1446 domain-containing protein [Bacillota bacterium]
MNVATDEIRVLSATGILGYGFPQESFEEGLRRKPHVIGIDAGSTDSGPYYLGSGKSLMGRESVKRDLSIALKGARALGVPLIVGTAGFSGADVHLSAAYELLREIAQENGLHFLVALIHAEFDKEYLKAQLRAGKIRSFVPGTRELTEDDIEGSTRIVGQMGVGPFIRALDMGAEVILAGRACDTAIFASYPLKNGFPHGLAVHMAKILECGAYCAVPGAVADCMMGTLRSDHFVIEPLNPRRKCTPTSVAAHTLYEQPDPYLIYEPEGVADLHDAVYEQLDGGRVKVSGSRFLEAGQYTIKLEGCRNVGYRTIAIAGVRDSAVIRRIDEIEASVRAHVENTLAGNTDPGSYRLKFRRYGLDAVFEAMEPERHSGRTYELGIVIDVVARTQELANAVCAVARSTLLHCEYEGRKATAGNLAVPFSPSDIAVGPVYEFNVYHLLQVDDLTAPFEVELVEL